MAGVVATVAMSAVMLALREQLGEAPPDAIAGATARAAGADPTEHETDAPAVQLHLTFGAGTGGAYALLPRTGAPVLRGTVTALAVWATAYQGWVPALGILPPASREAPQRVRVMVLAHVVYGAVLGLVEDALPRR